MARSIICSLAIIVADEQRQKTVKITPWEHEEGVRSNARQPGARVA